jgi:hypothetical protein
MKVKPATSMSEKEIEKEVELEKNIPAQPHTETEIRLRRLISHTIDEYKNFVFPEIYEIIKMKILFS